MEGDSVGNAVELCVFSRYLDCDLVNITALDFLRAQQSRCDGKDSASTADIQHMVCRSDVLLQQLHAQSGCVVGSGTKCHSRVEGQDNILRLFFIILPGWADDQMLAHPNRMIIFFPCRGPVLFVDIFHFHFQTAILSLRVLRLHAGQNFARTCQLLHALRIIRNIEGHAGFAVLHLLHHLLVDVIPVRCGVVQKFVKVLCILYHKALNAQTEQISGQRLDSFACGINFYFCPIHDGCFLSCSPFPGANDPSLLLSSSCQAASAPGILFVDFKDYPKNPGQKLGTFDYDYFHISCLLYQSSTRLLLYSMSGSLDL